MRAQNKRYVTTRTIYVDATAGVDTNGGASPDHPKQTVAGINALTGSILQTRLRNRVLFKRGEVWNSITSSLVVPASGSPSRSIYFGAYGTGANPVIAPYQRYTDFTLDSGARYKRTCGDPGQVWQDGVRLTQAASTTLASGQWYWALSVLYVRCTDDGDPNAHVLEHGVTNVHGCDINGKSYITIDGIDMLKAGHHGICFYAVAGAHHITLRGCTVSYCGLSGISMGTYAVLNLSDILIVSCTSTHNLGEGIWMGNGTRIEARGNIISSNADEPTKHISGGEGGGILCGIRSVDCIIRDNVITLNNNVGGDIIVEYEATYDRPVNTLVERNSCTHTVAANARCFRDEGSGTICRNNIFSINTSSGVAVESKDGGTGLMFLHNTCIVLNSGVAFNIAADAGANNTIKNNIFWHYTGSNDWLCQMIMVYTATQAGLVSDYNLFMNPDHQIFRYWGTNTNYLTGWQAGTGLDAHSSQADPVFVTNFTDLHLQTTSPAKNAGTTGLGVTTDYDQVVRDANPDIGAFEYH